MPEFRALRRQWRYTQDVQQQNLAVLRADLHNVFGGGRKDGGAFSADDFLPPRLRSVTPEQAAADARLYAQRKLRLISDRRPDTPEWKSLWGSGKSKPRKRA